MTAKATLLGRIGKKEVKTLKDNKTLTALSVATNINRKNEIGEKQEITSWHYVDCFGKLAEIVEKYTNVGDLVYLEGDISHKKITTKDGSKWIYSIKATQVELIGKTVKHENQNTNKDNDINNAYLYNDENLDLPF